MAVALPLGEVLADGPGPELCFELVDGTVITGRLDAKTITIRIASGNDLKVPVAAVKELTVGLNDHVGLVRRVETLVKALDSDKTRRDAVRKLIAHGPCIAPVVNRYVTGKGSRYLAELKEVLSAQRSWSTLHGREPGALARTLEARSRIRTSANTFFGTLVTVEFRIASPYGPVTVKADELLRISPAARFVRGKRGRWGVQLRNGTYVAGIATGQSLGVQSRYGTMVVPLAQIEQATFAGGGKSVQVTCWGGDRFAGAVDPKATISLKTDKGAADLAVGKIAGLGYGPVNLRGHLGYVYSIAFSPDGKRVASGSDGDNTIRLWDTSTGTELLTIKGHSDRVSSVAFSPDGKRLASGSYDKNIKLWDTAGGKELLAIQGRSVVRSPDGKYVVSDGQAAVLARWEWDKTIGKWVIVDRKKPPSAKGHSDKVYSVVFSPDGKRLASAGRDNIVRIWNTASGKELLALKGHSHWVVSVAFSPDGKRLASGSHDTTIKLWDTVTGKELRTLKGHVNPVSSIALCPDSKRLASSAVGIIKLWDTITGKQLLTLKGRGAYVHPVAFSPDGKLLASGHSEDMGATIWDTATGKKLLTLKGHKHGVWSVAFSPDGKLLASGGGDGTVKLWEVLDWTRAAK